MGFHSSLIKMCTGVLYSIHTFYKLTIFVYLQETQIIIIIIVIIILPWNL